MVGLSERGEDFMTPSEEDPGQNLERVDRRFGAGQSWVLPRFVVVLGAWCSSLQQPSVWSSVS